MDDAEKEIIIKYHETPALGGDGAYVGNDADKAKKLRIANGKGLLEKMTEQLIEGKARAKYIAQSKQKSAA